ncbi:MAG: hypothetical protein IJB70_03095 [Clostridia bacterium]|nr:hypothetical protein [Clostridia bacterium]
MRKLVTVILSFLIFMTSVVPQNAYAVSGVVSVSIDGVSVNFSYDTGYPYISPEGRTMVPLRVTMESFGAEVSWENNYAIIRKDTTTVRCPVGEKCVYRNNVKIANDAATTLVNSRVYLPIRVVLEAFGAEVTWDGGVKVTSPGSGSLVYTIENTPSVTRNYWGIWNNAISQKNAGQYTAAINTIMSISSVFIDENPGASSAMLFKHLGECYSNLKQYTNAATCFKREAYYWSTTPGMEQSMIDANRRANLIKTGTQVYVKNNDVSMGARTYFGETHEPKGGILVGAYAEGDTNIYNPYDPSRFYMDTFPRLVGKDMAAYLLYLPYGTSVSIYDTHIEEAADRGKLIQFSLEPRNGLWQVNSSDGYLVQLAKDMQARSRECRLVLRFAGEMNDTTSLWYSDPQTYISKFRIVADTFHKYAPSVPIIWAPNFFPSETIDEYYPGDEYVDYVGISSYQAHTPSTDPLGLGVDRSRWSNQPDYIYSHYGYKKPIIIVEGGVSCMDYDTCRDITPYAATQMEEFLKYLPIKYPNVKMFFVFDTDRDRFKYCLSNYPQYLQGYKNGISSSDLYLSDASRSDYTYDYYEIGNNVNVKAKSTELCSYVITPENNVSYVTYSINGNYCGIAYGAPYSVAVDFSPYKGSQVEVSVSSFAPDHSLLTTYTVKVNVV